MDTTQARKETRTRTPGRPRSADADDAILAAALAELGERGYARMSMDAVAARAGVSKPTVYLRHPTKAELATAAIASMRAQPRPAPPTTSAPTSSSTCASCAPASSAPTA